MANEKNICFSCEHFSITKFANNYEHNYCEKFYKQLKREVVKCRKYFPTGQTSLTDMYRIAWYPKMKIGFEHKIDFEKDEEEGIRTFKYGREK